MKELVAHYVYTHLSVAPEETTYILKSILRLAEVEYEIPETEYPETQSDESLHDNIEVNTLDPSSQTKIDFADMIKRSSRQDFTMDVYTGEIIKDDHKG